MSPLEDLVVDVGLVVAEEKVLWVYAGWSIAPMQHPFALRDRSKVDDPRDAMSAVLASVDLEGPVSATGSCP